jgi:alpha-tubulin suppressor-like RCC1 family protein
MTFPDNKKVKRLCAGSYFSLFLTTDNILYVAGANGLGSLGASESVSTISLRPITLIDNVHIVNMAAGWHKSIFLTECGRLLVFGEKGDKLYAKVQKHENQTLIEDTTIKTLSSTRRSKLVCHENSFMIFFSEDLNNVLTNFMLLDVVRRRYELSDVDVITY